MALALPWTMSPSKVSSFTDCALAFRFSVIDRLPEPPSPAAAKGTIVHRVLELLHLARPDQRTLESAIEAVPAVRAEVLADAEHHSLVVEDVAALDAEVEALVRGYFRIEDPTAVRSIGLELKLEAVVGGARLRGIIDRLDLTADGELVVTDYKTGKVPLERHERGRLGGVHTYSYLCEAQLGRRPVRVQLLYLGEPLAIVATPSDQSTRFLERKVGAVWSAVKRSCEREDFRPNPGRLCDWCAFKAHCPAFGGDPTLAKGPVQEPLDLAG